MLVPSYAETTCNLNEIGEHQFVDNCMNYKLMFLDFIQIICGLSIRWYKHTHVGPKNTQYSVLYVHQARAKNRPNVFFCWFCITCAQNASWSSLLWYRMYYPGEVSEDPLDLEYSKQVDGPWLLSALDHLSSCIWLYWRHYLEKQLLWCVIHKLQSQTRTVWMFPVERVMSKSMLTKEVRHRWY